MNLKRSGKYLFQEKKNNNFNVKGYVKVKVLNRGHLS